VTRVPIGYRLFVDVRDEMGREALHDALETGKRVAVMWNLHNGDLFALGEAIWRSPQAEWLLARPTVVPFVLLVKNPEPRLAQAAPAQVTNKGGRKPKYDWAGVAGFVTAYLVENDYPESRSELVAVITRWFDKAGSQPHPRQIERFVSTLFESRDPGKT
jgi:hypothetical protein